MAAEKYQSPQDNPEKARNMVIKLSERVDALEERIAVLEDQSRTSVTAKSVKKTESK